MTIEYFAMTPSGYNRAIAVSCIIGVLLSVYTLYVEMALEAEPNYEALCDISAHISCTHVLGSEYSRGFGIAGNLPNCVLGIFFYLFIIFLATFDHKSVVKLQLFLCWLSIIACVYLAFIMYFILYDLCVVCVATYAVNIANLLLTRGKISSLNASRWNLKQKKR